MTAREDQVFRWTRTPPLEWMHSLQRLAPFHDRAPHLTMSWLSGDKRTRVQRWLIWQCTPRAMASDFLWNGFLFTVLRHYAKDEETLWRSQYFLDTNCIPEPLWICQGPPVGHPFVFNEVDQLLARQVGIEPKAPRPGRLPYQPFFPDVALPALYRRSLFERNHVDPVDEFERRADAVRRAMRKDQVDRENAMLPDVVKYATPELLAGNVGARRVDPESTEGQRWVKGNADEQDAAYIELGQNVTHAN